MDITWRLMTRTIVGRTLAIGLLVFAVGCGGEFSPTSPPIDEFDLGFILSGQILDSPFRRALAGAEVSVVQSGRAGVRSTVTDGDGRFEIAGLSGGVTIDVSMDGYEGQALTVNVSSDMVVDFDLEIEDEDEEASDDDPEIG